MLHYRQLPVHGLIALALSAGALTSAQSRDLRADHPERLVLASLARDASLLHDGRHHGWSIRRVWAQGQQATVCAVAVDRRGLAVLTHGQLLLSQSTLTKRGSSWRVEDVSVRPVSVTESLRSQCQPQADQDVMMAAIAEMDRIPPTAGPVSAQQPKCQDDAQPAGQHSPAVPGRVRANGRSLLHSSPDLACRMGKHLVQNDKVFIEASTPQWARVRYTHPITGVVTVGWLRSPRVETYADAAEPSKQALATPSETQTSTSTSLP